MQLATDPETGQRGLFLFSKDGHMVSPWHDAPLIADKSQNLFHMIVEIPRGAKAKMEVSSPYYATGGRLKIPKISKEERHNPIQQDFSSNGKPRELSDIPPFRGYPCNYGAFPQVSLFLFHCPGAFCPSLGLMDMLR